MTENETNLPIKHASKLKVQYGSLVKILGEPFSIFEKYVKVFDLYFVATKSSPDEKVLHSASVLYQYIDNDDDGIPDNIEVYEKLVRQKATMIMFLDEDELNRNKRFFHENEKCKKVLVQDLQSDETRPGSCIPNKFDASLEECFHLLTVGYCLTYPQVFGLHPGSVIADCLDCARGGQFIEIPKRYPENAWFTYYDHTCDYQSMIIEYIYWAMTSILGAQEHRRKEIEHEWRHCCRDSVRKFDNVVFKLLTDEKYKFPTKIPLPLECLTMYQISSPCCAANADFAKYLEQRVNGDLVRASELKVQYGSLVIIFGKPFSIFEKYVKVFDLYFVATKSSPDEKVLHGASVLYQYIDNDDDGIPDNEEVYRTLVREKATMVMFCDDDELNRNDNFFRDNDKCKNILVQDLQSDETRPGSCIPRKFDASLEECFHLLTVGYCLTYPKVFGYFPGSVIADCLDCARGGRFTKVPKKYPEHAWFTYYDKTCDYESMIIEYIYWAMTSILGAQEHRREEIEHEWRHCSRDSVEKNDNVVFTLLTDAKYKFPTKIPLPLKCLKLYDIESPCSSSGSENSDDDTEHGNSVYSIIGAVTNFFSKKKFTRL